MINLGRPLTNNAPGKTDLAGRKTVGQMATTESLPGLMCELLSSPLHIKFETPGGLAQLSS